MKRYQGICVCSFYLFLIFIFTNIQAQETNSNISGRVLLNTDEIPSGATITAIHEPTQNKYISLTRNDGYFHFFDLKPGGPYSIIISYVGYEMFQKSNLYINLNSSHFVASDNIEALDFKLHRKSDTLQQVIVNNHNFNSLKTGVETSIASSTIQSLPSIGRGFHDYLRLVPQARVTGDGAISLAGQNNRANAFFIDGANNNDLIGVAPNGTNGGQTGSPPISMEAIEEIKISLAPYDAQFGNFTGGSINAITRSGTNETKATAWYSFRNKNLAGRSPQPVENSGSPGTFSRPRLSSFFNQTAGTWVSGAIVKNKLFYFTLVEKQSDNRPQPFDINDYHGASKQLQLNKLTDYLKTQYHYNPGSFLETTNQLKAARLLLKLDWNASASNKIMLSYHYNYAELTSPRFPNSATAVYAQNNGFILPAITNSSSFEWKHFFKKNMNNRLLLTYTSEAEDRRWIGSPFPRVIITDDPGYSIVFGSDGNSTVNKLTAKELTLFDAFKFIKGRNIFTAGVDFDYNYQHNALIQGYFGVYQYANLNNFLNGAAPSRYQNTYSLLDKPQGDNTVSATKFGTLRLSSFITDEIRLTTNFKLTVGLRLDRNAMLANPQEDKFFNDTAINTLSKYYNLDGARSGKSINTQWVLSPRIGLDYKLADYGLNIRGGAGVFSGHIAYTWEYFIYTKGVGNLDLSAPRTTNLSFVADPYNQPTPESSSISPSNSKRDVYLISPSFKYPSVFRTSIAVDKKFVSRWTFSLEGIITKNINEANFLNINALPPVGKSSLPDSRNVYSSTVSGPSTIPLKSDNGNPYSNIFLTANNHGKKGSSYNISFIVDKQFDNFSFHSSYTFGRSWVLFEMGDNNSGQLNQWHNTETVNGKNFTGLSTSDNDLQHRVMAYVSKKINYAKNKAATIITLFYNGQSGAPYSYVYAGSIIGDFSSNDRYDLIYIPTVKDLASMAFIQFTTSNGTGYTPQQQKDLLNSFIENDRYLNKHRGEFAERNGARLPFTNIIDLRLQEDLTIKIKAKKIRYSLILDVFNFTNMLNSNWGRIYFVASDNFQLVQFAKFASTNTSNQQYIPQYQFKPIGGTPYSLQTSTIPGNSARWISQLGIKVNLN